MSLPSFNDFISSLGPDFGDVLFAEAFPGESSPQGPDRTEIIGRSYAVSLVLLKHYHQWLSHMIEASSD